MLAGILAGSASAGAQVEVPKLPGSLKAAVPAPVVERLTGQPLVPAYVVDEQAAIALGKAFFWDMQAGSDGQACASCHFHAGADHRVRNQLSPGLKGGNGSFDAVRSSGERGPNLTLGLDDFPLHVFEDPADRDSKVLFDSDDVVSSQGVFPTQFEGLVPGSSGELTSVTSTPPGGDPVGFHVGGTNVRRVEPRHTPSVINSIFNHRNFWDGRANNIFNGVDPFGRRNTAARVLETQAGGNAVPLAVEFENASLASQAVGPLLSDFEMSAAGRSFPETGRKLLGLTPLGLQHVAPDDSVLGSFSLHPAPGLGGTYADMIQAAFAPRFWNSTQRFDEQLLPLPPGSTDGFTQMESNFSLFWGLAIQLYEATLVSDDAPFDQWAEGTLPSLGPQATLGLDVFMNQAGCIACHDTAAFTGASTLALLPPLGEGLLERMKTYQQVYNYLVEGDGFLAAPGGRYALQVDAEGTPVFLGIAGLGRGSVSLTYHPDAKPKHVQAGLGAEPHFQPQPAVYRVATFVLDGDGDPDTRDAGMFCLLEHGPPTAAPSLTLVVEDRIDHPDQVLLDAGGRVSLAGTLEGDMRLREPALYDNGFYNIGVRPTSEDPGVGADDPFGQPLSLSRQYMKGLLGLPQNDPFDVNPCLFQIPWQSEVDLVFYPGGFSGDGCAIVPTLNAANLKPIRRMRTATEGAFKVPSLRNVELSGPYFHNGGQATLEQVVDFYNRGADFAHENRFELVPGILPLHLTPVQQAALVAFLHTLTDERVRQEQAPFDHPQLFVPDGHPGDHLFVYDSNGDGQADATFLEDPSTFIELPAVGAGGRPAAGLPPLKAFLQD